MKIAVLGHNAIAKDIIKFANDKEFKKVHKILQDAEFILLDSSILNIWDNKNISSYMQDTDIDLLIHTDFAIPDEINETFQTFEDVNYNKIPTLAFYAKINGIKFLQVVDSPACDMKNLDERLKMTLIFQNIATKKDFSSIIAPNVYSTQPDDNSFVKSLYKQILTDNQQEFNIENKYIQITYAKNLCHEIFDVIYFGIQEDISLQTLFSDNVGQGGCTIKGIMTCLNNMEQIYFAKSATTNKKEDLLPTSGNRPFDLNLKEWKEEYDKLNEKIPLKNMEPIVGNFYSYLQLDEQFEDIDYE